MESNLASANAGFNKATFGTSTGAPFGNFTSPAGVANASSLSVKNVVSVPARQNSFDSTVSSLLGYANQAAGVFNSFTTSLASLRSTITPEVQTVKQQSSAQPVVGTPAPAKDSANTVTLVSPSSAGGVDMNLLLIGGAVLIGAFLLMRGSK